MKIWVYSLYDPDSGELLHKGTAKELTEVGLLCHPTRMSNIWAKYQRHLASGMPFQWRIEREQVEVRVERPRNVKELLPSKPDGFATSLKEGGFNERKRRGEGKATKAEQTAKNAKSRFERMIKDPTPLQQDVHALCLYNEAAKKAGRPEMNYGEWVSKGKPT